MVTAPLDSCSIQILKLVSSIQAEVSQLTSQLIIIYLVPANLSIL